MRRFTWVLIALTAATFATSVAVVWAARSAEMPEDHNEQWVALHGREAVSDLDRCNECHDSLSCRACHLAEWPHEEDWQALHGAEASRTDARGCYLCHSVSYCDPCHGGVRMPHPDGFLQEHSRSSFAESSCDVCHVERECDVCHREHAAHRAGGLTIP